MFSPGALVAIALLGAAQGSVIEQVGANQLETARVTQAAQRAEFGVEGDSSAFKFRFSNPVRFHVQL